MEKIRQFAREVSEREGCSLYDLEFGGSNSGRVLRVYIDREGGVSIDDCANVSRGLNLLLDVEDVIPGGAYELEVSSPGVERRLVEKWHFEKALGQPVRVRTNEPVQGAVETAKPSTNLEGELAQVDVDGILIRKNEQEWRVPMALIAKANVVFVPPTPQPKKNKKR